MEKKRNNLMPEVDGSKIMLNEWFEKWYYGSRPGTKPLTEIRQLHVQTAIADRLEAGRTPKPVREATGMFQNCVVAAAQIIRRKIFLLKWMLWSILKGMIKTNAKNSRIRNRK